MSNIIEDIFKQLDKDNIEKCNDKPIEYIENIIICNCGKEFISSDLYEKHIKSHIKSNIIYKCYYCGKILSTKFSLNNHIIYIHKKIKNFKCNYDNCNKYFSNIHNRNRHLYTHLPEKRFKCTICNKGFNDKYLLKKHLKFHNNTKIDRIINIEDRIYKCMHCNKAYVYKQNLKIHMLKHIDIYT